MFNITPEKRIDGYKVGHHAQYPKGLTMLYSNMTPRTLKYLKVLPGHDGKITVLGLQGYLQERLIEEWNKKFFGRPFFQIQKSYQRRVDDYLGKGKVTTEHLHALHEL